MYGRPDAAPQVRVAAGGNLRRCMAGARIPANSGMHELGKSACACELRVHGRRKCAGEQAVRCSAASSCRRWRESPPVHGRGVQHRKSGDTGTQKVCCCTGNGMQQRGKRASVCELGMQGRRKCAGVRAESTPRPCKLRKCKANPVPRHVRNCATTFQAHDKGEP